MIPAVIVLLAFLTGQWLMGIFVALVAFLIINQVKIRSEQHVPKLLVDNSRKEYAPFLEATGAHSGAMLGDVRHDPFQSGGLGTPAHERVEAGLIHKAHKGVLFIDEIATLKLKTQHDLLTAMQEKRFQIKQWCHGSNRASTLRLHSHSSRQFRYRPENASCTTIKNSRLWI